MKKETVNISPPQTWLSRVGLECIYNCIIKHPSHPMLPKTEERKKKIESEVDEMGLHKESFFEF